MLCTLYDDRFRDIVPLARQDQSGGAPPPQLTERLHELARAIDDEWKWCWTTTLDADVARAVDMLTTDA
jgi:hypothetical protein